MFYMNLTPRCRSNFHQMTEKKMRMSNNNFDASMKMVECNDLTFSTMKTKMRPCENDKIWTSTAHTCKVTI